MKRDKALLDYLRKLSPLCEKLVERALKEQIKIITFESFCEYWTKDPRNARTQPVEIRIGAGSFPEIGLEKVIVISMDWWPDGMKNRENRGMFEMALAHEIGHALTWSDQPFCMHPPLSKFPLCPCAYFEALAYKIGFDILRELNPKGNLKLLCRGKPTRPLKILHLDGFPSIFIKGWECYAKGMHKLDKCPKEKEIRELVEAIEKSKL